MSLRLCGLLQHKVGEEVYKDPLPLLVSVHISSISPSSEVPLARGNKVSVSYRMRRALLAKFLLWTGFVASYAVETGESMDRRAVQGTPINLS